MYRLSHGTAECCFAGFHNQVLLIKALSPPTVSLCLINLYYVSIVRDLSLLFLLTPQLYTYSNLKKIYLKSYQNSKNDVIISYSTQANNWLLLSINCTHIVSL